MMSVEHTFTAGALLGFLVLMVLVYSLLRLSAPKAPHIPREPMATQTTLSEQTRKALTSPILWLMLAIIAATLPTLGRDGLWDPWETHYGEVAREILSRSDWISLWSHQENWFWSKPILIFWLEAFCLRLFGIAYLPGQFPAHTEWALRLPAWGLAMATLVLIYAAITRVASKRAGLLSVLTLMTMPLFYFLTRQATTDMPFVATLTIAVCFFILAEHQALTSQNKTAQNKAASPHLKALLIGLVLSAALPQIIYLLSRNIVVHNPLSYGWRWDQALYGSKGNADVPGNPPLAYHGAHLPWLFVQPAFQALLWSALLTGLLALMRNVHRASNVLMIGCYFFASLSLLAKGLPGLLFPGLIVFLYIATQKRWRALYQGEYMIGRGLLITTIVGAPWFLAMFVRHGNAFIQRLFIHDHLNRLTVGVHGDIGDLGYFMAQIGYATFPWALSLPLLAVLARKQPSPLVTLVGFWFLVPFVLFNAMVTKFHHYIFPMLPPLACLLALALDQLFISAQEPSRWRRASQHALSALAVVCAVAAFGGMYGSLNGVVPKHVSASAISEWSPSHAGPWWLTFTLCVVAATCLLVALLFARPEPHDADASRRHPIIAALFFSGLAVFGFAGRDLAWRTTTRPYGDEKLVQLFIYMYGRAWPEHLDFRAALTGFSVTAALCAVLMLWRFSRSTGLSAFIALTCAMCLWGLHVYMHDLSPHWSQRQLIARYYKQRKSNHEPLVAWQMNWLGEYYYTGNHVTTFVDLDTTAFTKWLPSKKGKRIFVILEHSRVAHLRSLVGQKPLTTLSTERDNNKFVLVKVDL